MKTSVQLRNLLIAAAFFFCTAVGFLSVNVMSSCETKAQSCACSTALPCIAAIGGLDTVLPVNVETGGIVLMLTETMVILEAYMTMDLAAFSSAVAEKIADVTDDLTEWIDTFWYYNLLPAMQAMTRQLHAFDTYKDEHGGGFADSSDANRVDSKYMERDIESHREQRPSENVCVAGTVTGTMTRAAMFRRSYERAASADASPRSDNGTTVANGTNISSSADQLSRYKQYMSNYCNVDYNGGYSGCTTSGTYADQDLQVTDQIFMKDTIDLTNAAAQTVSPKQIVDDLVTNIVEPTIMEPVSPGAVVSEEGQHAILKGQAYKAKRQVLYDALYYIIARRAPGAGTKFGGGTGGMNFLQDMRTAAGVNAQYFSKNPSHNEIMEVMMSERFRTGQMSVDQIDEPENNEREMVVQQAFQAMLLSDQLDLLDRYGLILAAQASHEIKQAKPQSQHGEAQPVR